jgi:hypothetical protein
MEMPSLENLRDNLLLVWRERDQQEFSFTDSQIPGVSAEES